MLEYEVLRGGEFLDILTQLIDSARKRVYIATYIASLTSITEDVYYALARRRRSGVDVKVLLDGSSMEADRYNSRTVEFLNTLGVPTSRSSKFLHVKLYIVDNYAIIGSHNLTSMKGRESYEISVMLNSKRACSRLSEFFLSLYNGEEPEPHIDRDVLEDGTYYEIMTNCRILDDIYEKTLYSMKRVKALMYIATISKATKKYYRLLKEKEDEGVEVVLVLDGSFRISRHYNSKVHDYLKTLGLKKVVLTSKHNHAKVIVIDDYTIIGSHNLTSSSIAGRMELAVSLKNLSLANSMDYTIDDIFAAESSF